MMGPIIFYVENDKITKLWTRRHTMGWKSTKNYREKISDDGYVVLQEWVHYGDELWPDGSPRNRVKSVQLLKKERLQFLINTSQHWKKTIEEAQAQVIRNLKVKIEKITELQLEKIKALESELKTVRRNLKLYKILESNAQEYWQDYYWRCEKKDEEIEKLNSKIKTLKSEIELRQKCSEIHYERAEKNENECEKLEKELKLIQHHAKHFCNESSRLSALYNSIQDDCFKLRAENKELKEVLEAIRMTVVNQYKKEIKSKITGGK